MALGDRLAVHLDADKRIHHIRVKVPAPAFLNDGDRRFVGKRRFVNPAADESVVHIRNGHKARRDRNGIAGQSLRVARAVPLFPVRIGNFFGATQPLAALGGKAPEIELAPRGGEVATRVGDSADRPL